MVTPAEAIDRIQAVFGAHAGARALHARGRFFAGSFTATPEAAALCRAGHLQGDPVPVWVRWSNGVGHPRSKDGAPDVRGMAVSFRLPDGTATDLLGQAAPRFPVRTPEAFVRMVEASKSPASLPLFLLKNPSAVPALAANAKALALVPPRSFAEASYFPNPCLRVDLLGLLSRISRPATEAAAIRRRYAPLLVEVEPMPTPPGHPTVDVVDFATLAKLAARDDLLVLHWSRSDVDTFVLQTKAPPTASALEAPPSTSPGPPPPPSRPGQRSTSPPRRRHGRIHPEKCPSSELPASHLASASTQGTT